MDVYDFTPFEPTECLYCPNVPDSREHILQRSVGGRLQARVICSSCNNRLGDLVDQPFADVFALFVHALQIPKQGGERGVSLRATDVDGRRTTHNLTLTSLMSLPSSTGRTVKRGRLSTPTSPMSIRFHGDFKGLRRWRSSLAPKLSSMKSRAMRDSRAAPLR